MTITINPEATSDSVSAEPLSAEAGIELEDTSFMMPDLPDEPVDSAPVEQEDAQPDAMEDLSHEADAMQEEAYDTEMLVSQCTDMVALMDNLQALGVDVVAANKFVAAIPRENTSVM